MTKKKKKKNCKLAYGRQQGRRDSLVVLRCSSVRRIVFPTRLSLTSYHVVGVKSTPRVNRRENRTARARKREIPILPDYPKADGAESPCPSAVVGRGGRDRPRYVPTGRGVTTSRAGHDVTPGTPALPLRGDRFLSSAYVQVGVQTYVSYT